MEPNEELHPFAQAAIHAHEHIAPKVAEAKREHITGLLETFEQDLAPLIGPFVQNIVDDPETPEHLRSLLQPLTAPKHFSESILVGVALGSVISPVLTAALDPLLVELAKRAWSAALETNNILGGLPISPEILAASVLKGVLSQTEAEHVAALSGHTNASFDVMVRTAGNSIGLAEALLLLRRGQITLEHFQEIVRYSNINPAFYDDTEKLKYGPPTVGEVVAGALKGHLSEGDARRMIGEAGLNPDNFDWMLLTAGRPIGAVEASHLWRHGKIGDGELEDIVRSSDVNNRFLPAVKLASLWLPPPRSIMAMWRAKALTEAQARDAFQKAGVEEPFLSAMLDEGRNSGSSGVKEISQAATVRMYVTRLLTRAEAHTRIVDLGYPPVDADLLLDFGDDLRHEAQVNATLSKVRSRYVAHKLSKTEADHALATVDLPIPARTDLFALWDIQRDANMTIPTVASVIGAYRRQYINAAGCRARLLELGVDPSDIGIFVANGWPPTKPDEAAAAARAVVNA